MKKHINIDGVDYVPRALLLEALSIIGGMSQLYDDLAANPSEPTTEEKRKERALDRRWTALDKKADLPAKPKAKEIRA